MEIELSASQYTDEQAEQILHSLYQTFHGREPDSMGRQFFLPILREHGFRGIASVLYQMLNSEETQQRVMKEIKEVWSSQLGREPDDDDVAQFGHSVRFFGEKGKDGLTRSMSATEEQRKKASQLTQDGNPGAAEKLLRELIRDPNTPKSWQLHHDLGLSLYRQGERQREAGNPDAAAKYYEAAIEPYEKAVLLNMFDDNWVWSCDDLKYAFANQETLQKVDEGITFFREVLARFPQRWTAWHQLGWLYWRRARYVQEKQECYSQAVESYQKAVEMIGDGSDWPWSATDLMRCYSEAGLPAVGYQYFTRVAETNPNNWGIWHALGWVTFTALGKPAEAIGYYRTATEKHTGSGWVWSWYDMGLCYKALDRRADAQVCFLWALHDDARCWAAYNELALGAIALKQWGDVVGHVQNGLTIKRDAPSLWSALGEFYRCNDEPNLFFAWLAYRVGQKHDPAAAAHVQNLAEKYQEDLRVFLEEKLDYDNDLPAACFDLKINMDNLEGRTLRRKVLSLIQECNRQNKVDELINWMRKHRRDVFPDILQQYADEWRF
jgi:tetratricopeptide (TPR) repeat protein